MRTRTAESPRTAPRRIQYNVGADPGIFHDILKTLRVESWTRNVIKLRAYVKVEPSITTTKQEEYVFTRKGELRREQGNAKAYALKFGIDYWL